MRELGIGSGYVDGVYCCEVTRDEGSSEPGMRSPTRAAQISSNVISNSAAVTGPCALNRVARHPPLPMEFLATVGRSLGQEG